MKIQLNFTKKELDMLWLSECRSFIRDQKERFTIINSNLCMQDILKVDSRYECKMAFFDRLVEAKIFQSVLKKYNAILIDEEGDTTFCVWYAVKMLDRKVKVKR